MVAGASYDQSTQPLLLLTEARGSIVDGEIASSGLSLDRPSRGSSTSDLEDAVAGAERALGTYSIVSRCEERPPVTGLQSIHVAVATGPRRGPDGGGLRTSVTGTGVDTDPQAARLRAIVEAIERYALVWPTRTAEIVRAPFTHTRDRALPLEAFGVFDEAQCVDKPERRLPAETDEIDWAWSRSLVTDTPVLLPAWAACPFASPTATPGGLASSTGAASQVSTHAAVLSGLFEVVERDALMLHWLNRRPPRRIAIPANSEFGHWTDSHFSPGDLDFILLDLTCDTGLPTVACLALGDGQQRPAAVMGAATRSHPVEAARKALFECTQILAALETLDWADEPPLSPSDVRTFEDHARFYAHREAAAHLSVLLEGVDTVDIDELPVLPGDEPSDHLRTCVQRLADLDLNVCTVDLTTPDVSQCGFRVVKTVIPGMVDINADAQSPPLGCERIHTAARRLGWTALSTADLNSAPCPLA
jgi:ribosomal protein S12 methylthiotransferase accessory factor